jgi:hypothetical protein
VLWVQFWVKYLCTDIPVLTIIIADEVGGLYCVPHLLPLASILSEVYAERKEKHPSLLAQLTLRSEGQ